jgi:hypothetical protein
VNKSDTLRLIQDGAEQTTALAAHFVFLRYSRQRQRGNWKNPTVIQYTSKKPDKGGLVWGFCRSRIYSAAKLARIDIVDGEILVCRDKSFINPSTTTVSGNTPFKI